MPDSLKSLVFVLALVGCLPVVLRAEVTATSANGFQVKHVGTVNADRALAFSKFVEEFSRWYDANHTYSLKAENLSIDLERHCMLEKLPEGGFVRHMEVVFYQPGRMIRMTGGLGPLQGLGVFGALTFEFQPVEGSAEATQVTLTYNVSGAEFLKLNDIASPVNSVLGMQLAAFQKYVNQ